MMVVKRFHDYLLPTHDKVLAQYENVKHLAVIDGFLTRASGYQFYNTSKFTFETLLADPDNIETNFKDYLAGFSANAQDVLSKFDFAFMARQKKVTIDGRDYKIDLLFFYRKLRRLVVVEPKIGGFEPEYKSQVELYLR